MPKYFRVFGKLWHNLPMTFHASNFAPFPAGRPRRLRRDAFTRNLVRESTLTSSDFIYPVFVVDGKQQRQPVASMAAELGEK